MSFTIDLGALRGFSENMARMVVEAAAITVRDEVVTQMEPGPTRTGRTYPIPGTGASYTASAPGEPPAVREGRYVASLKYTPAFRSGDYIVARAYTDLLVDGHVLGELLEFGTVKMAPRPHWQPALELVQPAIRQMLNDARGR